VGIDVFKLFAVQSLFRLGPEVGEQECEEKNDDA